MSSAGKLRQVLKKNGNIDEYLKECISFTDCGLKWNFLAGRKVFMSNNARDNKWSKCKG